jgi:hypothetical protein
VLRRIVCERGLLVGDAAGAVSPLTAGGLDPCMRMSEQAAAVIDDALRRARPAALGGYDGETLRRRFRGRLALRRALARIRTPALAEAGFVPLRTRLGGMAAGRILFGDGSFPAETCEGPHHCGRGARRTSGRPAHHRVPRHTGRMSTDPDVHTPAHVVLVPGFWLGAWAWDDVLALLRQRGVPALALTLPGLEADHPDRGAVSLDDHVRAIEEALALAQEGARTVLVAHSGAAAPATVAVDRHVDGVDHVVWVDTAPVVDGYAMNPDIEGDEYPLSAQYDEELEQGSMAGLSEEQLEVFRRRAVPQPAGALREAVTLRDDRRLDVPGTVVCTAFSAADYRSYAEDGAPFLAGLREHRALTLVDLPTGHWPMWSRPADLADIIATAAGGE